MPIDHSSPLLITGSAGFVGRNLTARLKALGYENLLLFDTDTDPALLPVYAERAAFVFHIAGVNRPLDCSEFYTGNLDLTQTLLDALYTARSKAPVLLTSSTQAGNGTDYGSSKLAAEEAVFEHQKRSGTPMYVYRLPGLFGKWSRPGYNSVVATFCHNVANDLDIEVRDPEFQLPLCYIDDVVDSFIGAMLGESEAPAFGCFMEVQPIYIVPLGTLAETILSFKQNRKTLALPNMQDSFERKLYAAYLSYLPRGEFSYPLKANVDERGSFTEFLRTPDRGQVSINIAKPGITKGNHWHDSKNEKFLVVSGEAVIRFRKAGESTVEEYYVSGNEPVVVDIPTGYTHNIENVGVTDLVTVMWASEPFDPERPDTYFEKV